VPEASWFADWFVVRCLVGWWSWVTEAFLDLLEAVQGLKTPQFALLIGERGWSDGRRAREGFQPHAADVKVFLEAIGLEQVG
jgi:exo-beta-1,3-glucanase (GH17 family)